MKAYCCTCGKQIVSDSSFTGNSRTTQGPVKLMGFGTVICHSCGKELDGNGLFPEERMSLGLSPDPKSPV